MSTQVSGYLTVADFVEMVRKKFNSDKSPAEIQDEKIKQLSESQDMAAFSSQNRAQQDQENERYGVDIVV